MSIVLIAACWQSGPEDPIERYVLVALADNASDEGFAYPSIETLADKTRMSERTIRRTLQSLAAAGWIEVNHRNKGKGSTYWVLRSRLGLPEGIRPVLSVQRKASPDSVSVQRKASPDSVSLSADSVSLSADSVSKPPDPLKGVTVINRQEPSGGTGSLDQASRYDFVSNPAESIPEGLSLFEYAAGVLEQCNIVSTFKLRAQWGEAIRLLAKLEQVKWSEATGLMILRAQAAIAAGEMNGFWIADGKWKSESAVQPLDSKAIAAEKFRREMHAARSANQ